MQKATIYRKPMGESLFEEDFTIKTCLKWVTLLNSFPSWSTLKIFRPSLEDELIKKNCKTPAGRPQTNVVLIFKVILLQRYYGLVDHQTQYQIKAGQGKDL